MAGPAQHIPSDNAAEIVRAWDECGNIAEVARRTGRTRNTVRKYVEAEKARREAGGAPGRPPTPPAAPATETAGIRESADGTAVATATTGEVVKTLEDAVRVAGVDLTVWYVDRWEASQWSTPLNVKQGQSARELTNSKGQSRQELGWEPSRLVQQQQYRVKLYLRRIVSRAVREALDALYDRMKAHAPRYPKPDRPAKATGEPYMAVFGLFDAHFGKLCWEPETASGYDLKLAEMLYRNAVTDLLAEASHRRIDRVLLPVGNDFFHMDNRRNTTFNGTPQDVDGRYAKVFEAGVAAVIWAVELLAGVAPVRVVWVPGNHDPTTSYHLCREVGAWFHRSDRVEADHGPRERKYERWGSNLIGLTHGDEIKPEDLPSQMLADVRAEMATADHCEWLIGHMHRAREWVAKSTDTHKGTTVRVLRSLAGTDAWHYRKGYVGASQAAEVFFYGRDRGYAGHAVVPARAA